jgi:hypothetical protein
LLELLEQVIHRVIDELHLVMVDAGLDVSGDLFTDVIGTADQTGVGNSVPPLPFSSASSFNAAIRPGYSSGGIQGGIHPLENSAVISMAVGPCPPVHIGGYGFWTGFGQISVSSKLMYSPS